jgi:hypothetical protein
MARLAVNIKTLTGSSSTLLNMHISTPCLIGCRSCASVSKTPSLLMLVTKQCSAAISKSSSPASGVQSAFLAHRHWIQVRSCLIVSNQVFCIADNVSSSVCACLVSFDVTAAGLRYLGTQSPLGCHQRCHRTSSTLFPLPSSAMSDM